MNILTWWRRTPEEQLDKNNPYVRGQKGHNTHEEDMQQSIRYRGRVTAGLLLLLGGSIYGNYYQVTQAKVQYQLVQIDRHYQPVVTPARQVNLIPDSDPQKQGITAKFLVEHITKRQQRILDVGQLAKDLTEAREAMLGPAFKKFEISFNAEKPFDRIKRERVTVKIDPPVAMTNKTWLAKWQQHVTDTNGNVLREEECSGQFRIEQDPRRVEPLNIFGLVIVDAEIPCEKSE